MLDASRVKSWDEIVKFYAKDIDELSEQELRNRIETLKLGLEDKLKKIEFDIADMKYAFFERSQRQFVHSLVPKAIRRVCFSL